MVTQINDLDAMANEFKVQSVDGAVVPVANGNGRQQTDGRAFAEPESH